MALKMNYRRWTVVSTVVVGSAVAIIGYISGAMVSAAIFLAVQGFALGVLLLATRPSDGPTHVGHAAAQAAAGAGDVIVYWMPGCIFCDLLKRNLGRARHDVSWVNIVGDVEAANFVAGYHGGKETVPTAVTGSGEMIDATPAAIKAHLAAAG